MPCTSSVMRAPVSASISSTIILPSHLASSLSPTQYLCAKLPVQRLAGLCLHSTQAAKLQPWYLRMYLSEWVPCNLLSRGLFLIAYPVLVRRIARAALDRVELAQHACGRIAAVVPVKIDIIPSDTLQLLGR